MPLPDLAEAPRHAAAPPIRVLIVDDSAVVRAVVTRLLEDDPGIRVVARAADGREAVAVVSREPVDVVLLDVAMPVMDGLETLPLLLRANPAARVLMASSLTTHGAEVTLRALRLGAVDYLPKPDPAAFRGDQYRQELRARIHAIARMRPGDERGTETIPEPPPRPRSGGRAGTPLLLAVGSSTGGPQALFTLVEKLGADLSVPVVVCQHMPAVFTPILAAHLHRHGVLPCAEASNGEELRPGRLYVAPGDRHLLVERDGPRLHARLSDAAPENFCRPSVDTMLRSAARACDGRVVIVMLTGMGHDGLEGTRSVVTAGGAALAQDEASSVVWGMPGAVARAGLCRAVLPLAELGGRARAMLDGGAGGGLVGSRAG